MPCPKALVETEYLQQIVQRYPHRDRTAEAKFLLGNRAKGTPRNKSSNIVGVGRPHPYV
jgi:hypothetical protein